MDMVLVTMTDKYVVQHVMHHYTTNLCKAMRLRHIYDSVCTFTNATYSLMRIAGGHPNWDSDGYELREVVVSESSRRSPLIFTSMPAKRPLVT
jgi:hypothetical protein